MARLLPEIILLSLAFLCSPALQGKPKATQPKTVQSAAATVRIGTFNLRVQNADKDENAWSERHARVLRSIEDNAFDVFGVQEVIQDVQSTLLMELGGKYNGIYFCTYSQDGIGSKPAMGTFYDKKRFKLLSYNYFWLADNPDEMTVNDHFSRMKNGERVVSKFVRGGQCLTLKDKVSGKIFFFINHHGILNKDENLRYAHVLVDIEKKYNPNGYPSFLVGDFNARVRHPSHQTLRRHWKDSWEASGLSDRPSTMNSFNTDSTKWDPLKHIDFIYYRNVSAPVEYKCNQALYDGLCASDHFPVWADFEF